MFDTIDNAQVDNKNTSKPWQRIGLLLVLIWVGIFAYFFYDISRPMRASETLAYDSGVHLYMKYIPAINGLATLCMYLSIRLKEPNTVIKVVTSLITFLFSATYIISKIGRLIL